jgi:phosphopantetheinyl transferase
VTALAVTRSAVGYVSGDIDLVDCNDDVAARISGMALRYFELPESLLMLLYGFENRPSALRSVEVGGHRVFLLDGWSPEVLRQGDSIWLRALAHAVLGPEERASWYKLPSEGPRRIEWMIGRVALKETVRIALSAENRSAPDLTLLRVIVDDRGRPIVAVDGETGLFDVSLSHCDGVAATMAISNKFRAGVDIEKVAAGTKPRWTEFAFTAEERALAGTSDIALVTLWCAKESVAKAVGVGLQGRPDLFRISRLAPGEVEVEAGEEKILVATIVDRGFVVAACCADVLKANRMARKLSGNAQPISSLMAG